MDLALAVTAAAFAVIILVFNKDVSELITVVQSSVGAPFSPKVNRISTVLFGILLLATMVFVILVKVA